MSFTVTAVIPTWNRADLLRRILENLAAQTHPPDVALVIDNGSTDGSIDVARQLGAEVIAFEKNLGFAAAINAGVERSRTDGVFIVNNDVVLSPQWLELARTVIEAKKASFVCGKLLRPQSADLDGSWDLLSRGCYAWRCGYAKPDSEVWSRPHAIQWAPMTAALYRRQVFKIAGLLDTRFESYYEDVEYGLRCALHQVTGFYEPSLVAYHLSKTTLGRASARVYFNSARNQIYILARYYGLPMLRRFWWPVLVGQTLSLMAAARQRNFFSALLGKWAGLRHWTQFRSSLTPLQQARIEQLLTESEREISALQAQSGFDLYWRWYFRLVRSARA